MRPEFITVGTIVNAHGVRGEVKVNPHGFDPAFIASFHTLYLNGQAVAVKAVRVHKSTVLLTLPGVEDMDSALALKGCTVAIRRTDAHLPKGQFFDEELEGCAVVDDYPRVGKCYFTGTMPCDGAISQTNILTRHFKELPSFQITPPQRVNEPEVQTYAVKNLKKGIEFLEQQFGVKWDWDAFWKNAEMYNESSRCMIEKWDVNCTEHPQVCGAALALQREYEFMAAACMDKFMLKTDRRVTKMMLKGYEQDKAANAPQPKYRCLVWACPAHYYTNFTYWTQHCWGVTCVNDMEAMLSYQPITIGDKEQALADLVRCYEKMMMRSHTNGGYVNLLDECWKMCEKFHTNIVIMYDHVSCKNVGGLHGLFEDQARERGIHLIWIPHDVMDPRTVSRREMREAFSQYMVTVLNEKPLDPTLLDYEDTLSW